MCVPRSVESEERLNGTPGIQSTFVWKETKKI